MNKPKWTAKKYMGDDSFSWAVVDKNYLPKGHRGVIFDYLPQGAIAFTGLTRRNAQYYAKYLNSSKQELS